MNVGVLNVGALIARVQANKVLNVGILIVRALGVGVLNVGVPSFAIQIIGALGIGVLPILMLIVGAQSTLHAAATGLPFFQTKGGMTSQSETAAWSTGMTPGKLDLNTFLGPAASSVHLVQLVSRLTDIRHHSQVMASARLTGNSISSFTSKLKTNLFSSAY